MLKGKFVDRGPYRRVVMDDSVIKVEFTPIRLPGGDRIISESIEIDPLFPHSVRASVDPRDCQCMPGRRIVGHVRPHEMPWQRWIWYFFTLKIA
jgi:hypothetical protein